MATLAPPPPGSATASITLLPHKLTHHIAYTPTHLRLNPNIRVLALCYQDIFHFLKESFFFKKYTQIQSLSEFSDMETMKFYLDTWQPWRKGRGTVNIWIY